MSSPSFREDQIRFMKEAIHLSIQNMEKGQGGPFGAVVVKNGAIIGRGFNQVTSMNDPTSHAEVMAIRDACRALGDFQLVGCEIYTSCEPCPMCLGAIYWARPDKVYYGNSKQDAKNIGFDDSFIYEEISKSLENRKIPMIQLLPKKALVAFQQWQDKTDKIEY